jgi:DNA polymerase-3 subunit chi
VRVDFYHLTRDPAEAAIALIARKAGEAGKRLLVVSDDAGQLQRVSAALWAAPGTFLANGLLGSPHDARQPVLLAADLDPANGASFLVLADGRWREGARFERTFLFFDGSTIEHARARWRELGARPETERHYWKQDGGRWVEAT